MCVAILVCNDRANSNEKREHNDQSTSSRWLSSFLSLASAYFYSLPTRHHRTVYIIRRDTCPDKIHQLSFTLGEKPVSKICQLLRSTLTVANFRFSSIIRKRSRQYFNCFVPSTCTSFVVRCFSRLFLIRASLSLICLFSCSLKSEKDQFEYEPPV